MRLFFTPPMLARAAAVAAVWLACLGQSPAQGIALTATNTVPGGTPEAANAVQVDRVNFSSVADPTNPRKQWTQVEVDFTTKSNPDKDAPNAKWVSGVEMTITLAWGKAPQLDLAMSASASFLALEVNASNSMYFFIPPEVLAFSRRLAILPGSPPDYYVVQFKVNGTDQTIKGKALSTSLPTAEGFLTASTEAVSKSDGYLIPCFDAPHYIFDPVNQNSQRLVPTFLHGGHKP